MYELIRLSEQASYIDCPAKIGIYHASPSEVYLIDSGSDKDAGRKVRQILERNQWHLKGILITHSNADHIGGNRYLQNQTGCKIFAGGIEAAFTRAPLLEPSFLYGGFPCKELRHKFLLAQESDVCEFSVPDFPAEIEILPLPGHFFEMSGFRLPDGTVFLADCISSRATLEKYAVPFLYDVEACLQTLDKVEAMEAPMFVPSHAEAAPDLRELIAFNRKHILEIAERILEICQEPKPFEQVLQALFHLYGLQMDFAQYVLVGSTVRSYLAWLHDKGRLDACFTNAVLLWKTL